jgi:hypothetical protein
MRSVIRGQTPTPGKKFLWGSGFPGCGLAPLKTDATYGPTTELWFIREEKEYIRPFSDMRSRYVFHGSWDAQPGPDPQTRFALLLLNPRANGERVKEFAEAFLNRGSSVFRLAL